MVGGFGGSFRHRGMYSLRVAEVVCETADVSSFIFHVPDDLSEKYAYRAGQFLTFRVEFDGVAHLRSYSMSSSPLVDERMRVTVKRVAGGVVSNWMNDVLAPGDELVATVPSGTFVVDGDAGEMVAFAGGSGITPVLSIIKTVLAGSTRRARLLYANRDRDSVIFGTELADLKERYGDTGSRWRSTTTAIPAISSRRPSALSWGRTVTPGSSRAGPNRSWPASWKAPR